MDKINCLPDELLVKILSVVPTRIAVSTSILSKRWEFLWMWLPELEFVSRRNSSPALRDFIDKNLPLHRAPVIEFLSLELSDSKPEDIKRWVGIAVSRYVCELEISCYGDDNENIFPSSFYTCKSLVILELYGVILIDVPSIVCLPSLETLKLFDVTLMDVPSMVCLPSLKTLELVSVIYENEESLQKLLSACPVLEELSMYFAGDDKVEQFTIIVPSLQSLSLFIDDHIRIVGYVIDTPSLKYFKLEDRNDFIHYSDIENMPMLKEAYVDVVFHVLESVLESITSVERLTLCSEGACV